MKNGEGKWREMEVTGDKVLDSGKIQAYLVLLRLASLCFTDVPFFTLKAKPSTIKISTHFIVVIWIRGMPVCNAPRMSRIKAGNLCFTFLFKHFS